MFRWRDYVCHPAHLETEIEIDDIADGAGGSDGDNWKLKFNFANLQQNKFKPVSN